MKAICALDFRSYEPIDEEQRYEIDFKVKVPLMNNLAVAFLQLSEQQEVSLEESNHFLFRSKNLLEQVLKI